MDTSDFDATNPHTPLNGDTSFFPPLTPSCKPTSVSSAHSKRVQTSSSQGSLQSSLSSRSRTSSSLSSARSGGSGLEEKISRPRSLLSRSIDSETLAIAIELSNLKARRQKDEQETFAKIMDSSDQLTSCLKSTSGAGTPLPRKTASAKPKRDSPPPKGEYTGPGAHYLKWYIPKHIAGSRALQRTASATASRSRFICSPLHRPDKQEWTNKLIDPKASGLRIPTAVPPRIIDYPCTWENNLKDELKKYQLTMNSESPLSPQRKPKSVQLKSLPLPSKKPKKKDYAVDSSDLKVNGSMFSKAHVAPMPWFIVHPDWRNEPRITRTWADLEGGEEESNLGDKQTD